VTVEISPGGSDEEVAAIVAVIEAMWPRPAIVESTPTRRVPTWRFSNRWWIKPLASRRDRPHR
jgi:hypothetical protein